MTVLVGICVDIAKLCIVRVIDFERDNSMKRNVLVLLTMILLLAVAMPLLARNAKASAEAAEAAVASDANESALDYHSPYQGIEKNEANDTPGASGSLSPWIALAVISLVGSAMVVIAEKRRNCESTQ